MILPEPLDKLKWTHLRNRAASTYANASFLHQEIGSRLCERLDGLRLSPRTILNMGAAIGTESKLLTKHYRRAHIICLEGALQLLRQAKKQAGWFHRQSFICADFEAPPLADASVDLIFSDLLFQWTTDWKKLLAECYRILRPGGLLLFSTLGPDTLQELRESWEAVDTHPHVNHFPDMHLVGDSLLQARFTSPVIDMEKITLTYQSVMGLLHDLKETGSSCARFNKETGCLGKQRLAAMIQHYQRFQDASGQFPATVEVVYASAWKPTLEVIKQSATEAVQQTVYVPVSAIMRERVN